MAVQDYTVTKLKTGWKKSNGEEHNEGYLSVKGRVEHYCATETFFFLKYGILFPPSPDFTQK